MISSLSDSEPENEQKTQNGQLERFKGIENKQQLIKKAKFEWDEIVAFTINFIKNNVNWNSPYHLCDLCLRKDISEKFDIELAEKLSLYFNKYSKVNKDLKRYIDTLVEKNDYRYNYAVLVASYNLNMCFDLLKVNNVCLTKQCDCDYMAIDRAISNNNTTIASAVIETGLNLNGSGFGERRFVDSALGCGYEGVLRLLLFYGSIFKTKPSMLYFENSQFKPSVLKGLVLSQTQVDSICIKTEKDRTSKTKNIMTEKECIELGVIIMTKERFSEAIMHLELPESIVRLVFAHLFYVEDQKCISAN